MCNMFNAKLELLKDVQKTGAKANLSMSLNLITGQCVGTVQPIIMNDDHTSIKKNLKSSRNVSLRSSDF